MTINPSGSLPHGARILAQLFPHCHPFFAPTPSQLCAHDRFLLFASDGVWEYLSSQEVADLVGKQVRPRKGVPNPYFLLVLYSIHAVVRKYGGLGLPRTDLANPSPRPAHHSHLHASIPNSP